MLMLRSSARRGVLRRLLQRGLSISAAARASPAPSQDVHVSLESCIARRESSRALAAFDQLQPAQQSDPGLLQRLALLVAKRGQPHEAPRAAQMLCGLLAQPGFAADDATQLAAIYALDACLRQRRLEDALLLFAAAREHDVLVDLPAVDALLRALVAARRVDEAAEILRRVTAQHDVRPSERTFQPVLVAVMRQRRYEDVAALIEHGRVNEVDFSPETYDPLVDLTQEQYSAEDVERLGRFMEYVNDALRADGYWEDDDDDDDEDEDGVIFEDDDDDDDEFDGDDFDEDEFD
ncbi:mitochondrial protein [Phytophthora cinnamomi]|uniref:mitochondrial protein n=1 Tax=Phytophthora cinnamomi TaxID=4785 RepID=UPI003559B7F2|nr:mitochondrial protein [Phytophthora cinnamomi]